MPELLQRQPVLQPVEKLPMIDNYQRVETLPDVMKTWRKFGFVPPTEYRTDYKFKEQK